MPGGAAIKDHVCNCRSIFRSISPLSNAMVANGQLLLFRNVTRRRNGCRMPAVSNQKEIQH
jgi:hypothetical protein